MNRAFIAFSVLLLATIYSCGALPRSSHDDQDAPIITNTDPTATGTITGIVLQSTDSSYTSTSIYFYDLALGKISLLTGGESGDTYTKWLGSKMYLFNRANGRTVYSSFAPRSGIASRTTERPTPGAAKYDPVGAMIGPESELVLAMNATGSVVFANESDNTVTTKISSVDTGSTTQPFRPADLWLDGTTAYVTHQALDSQYKATGVGRVYGIAKDNGVWSLKSLQGTALVISNPVYASSRSDHSAIIAGVCYSTSGTACVPGVDQFNVQSGTTTHLSAWDATKWDANGGFYTDISDDTLLTCIKDKSTQQDVLARYKIADGTITKLTDVSSPGCNGVIADRVGKRIFVGQTTGTSGTILILDANGATQNTATLSAGLSGMTASFD